MSKLRKKAMIRLVLCLLALVASIAFSVFLLSGKNSDSGASSAPAVSDSAAADSSTDENVDSTPAESTDQPAESTENTESVESAEPTPEPVADETPAPAEPTTFDGLTEQPTTVFTEGDQKTYTTPSDSNMNLRPGPSTDSGDPVAKIPAGTSVTALGTNADGTWVVVQYDGQYGWLMMSYLTAQ